MERKISFGTQVPNLKYRQRIGVYAVILNSSSSLVSAVKTTAGHYFLPGGGLEHNETHESCLLREIIEETGFQAEIGLFIGQAEQYFISRQNEPILNQGNFYLAKLLDKTHTTIDDDHELTWVNTCNIDELLVHEHHVWAVKQGLKFVHE